MELRDLEYFSVVAEHGSVRRAADALDRSPPALSKSLRRLEKAVGAKLVKRVAKGIELTAVGTAMVDQARRIRLALHDASHEAADLSQGRAGHLRIAVGPVIAEDLPGVYAILLRGTPKLTLEILVTDNDEAIPLLQQGKLDLIFNTLPVFPYEGTAQEFLYAADWVVCAAANHPLFRKKRISIADLGRESWALSNPSLWPQSQTSMAKLFQNRQFPPPRIAILTRSLPLRLHIWATTRLLGWTSRHVLRGAAGSRLKEIPVKELTWRRQTGVIYRKDAYLSPAARRFIDILKAAARETGRVEG